MAFKFNSNQEAADKKRRRKLAATGTGLGALAFGPGRSALGVVAKVAKVGTGLTIGAPIGLLQSAARVLKGGDTGGTFGKYFEIGRKLTAPADIGGGSTPNIPLKNTATQGASKMNVLEKTSNLTKGTTVYNTDLAKKATEGVRKKVTEAKLPDNLKVGKPGTQLKLSFPKVGVLDLVGVFAPFIKMAHGDMTKKNKIY
tara:strand:+ start:1696 stop:2292 length:597 start_codon:yes stop_codon:yes gene_type:complete